MRVVVAGLAVFAMFFGTGNLVFPLMLGRDSSAAWPWAVAGFALTDLVLTFAGMAVMLHFDGEATRFFKPGGRWSVALLPWLCLLLIGPMAVMPRGIQIGYGSLASTGADVPVWLFSTVFVVLAWLANRRPGRLIEIVGAWFTPVKIILLSTVIGGCFLASHQAPPTALAPSPGATFGRGFMEGYQAMDLLGAIFFGAALMTHFSGVEDIRSRRRAALAATAIGMLLLLLVYLALTSLGHRYGEVLAGLPATQMLPRIAKLALGDLSEEITAATIIIANLTMVVTVSSVFSDYCARHVPALEGRYVPVLTATLAVTWLVSLLHFETILAGAALVLDWLYPVLILLTGVNAFRIWWPGRVRRA